MPGALAAQPWLTPLMHLKGEILRTAGDHLLPCTVPKTTRCQTFRQQGARRQVKSLYNQAPAAAAGSLLLLPRQTQPCPRRILLISLPLIQ